MPPWMGGGEMIQDVFLDHSTYAPPPSRFEAGTPAIAEAIGLGAAVDYLHDIGMQQIHDYEEDIGGYLQQEVGSRHVGWSCIAAAEQGDCSCLQQRIDTRGLCSTME